MFISSREKLHHIYKHEKDIYIIYSVLIFLHNCPLLIPLHNTAVLIKIYIYIIYIYIIYIYFIYIIYIVVIDVDV